MPGNFDLIEADDEVEIPLDEEILSMLEESDEAILEEIPDIQAASNVPSSTDPALPQAPVPKQSCPNCGKTYSRDFYFKRHLITCKDDLSKEIRANDNAHEEKSCYKNQFGQKILKPALKAIADDDILNLRFDGFKTKGNKTSDVAKELVESFDCTTDWVHTFADVFVEVVFVNITINKSTKQCIAMHNFTIDVDNKNILVNGCQTLQSQDPEVIDFFFSKLVKYIFSFSVEWRKRKNFNDSDVDDEIVDICMNHREVNVLRYVAGFLPFSLSKKFSNTNNPVFFTINSVLNSWRATETDTSNSRFDFSKVWTDNINRGRLFQVNDDFFIFVRNMEMVARSVFNVKKLRKYKNEDLRDVLMERFENNTMLISSWQKITRHWDHEEALLILRKSIFRKWIDIRARAFVNVWIQNLKRKNAIRSKKSETSLRKSLLNCAK